MGPGLNEGGPPAVTLRLRGHCVETGAKQQYRLLTGRYFEAGVAEAAVLEKKIGLLRKFIESADFPGLRASDPRLSGEVESEVVIFLREDGTVGFAVR